MKVGAKVGADSQPTNTLAANFHHIYILPTGSKIFTVVEDEPSYSFKLNFQWNECNKMSDEEDIFITFWILFPFPTMKKQGMSEQHFLGFMDSQVPGNLIMSTYPLFDLCLLFKFLVS